MGVVAEDRDHLLLLRERTYQMVVVRGEVPHRPPPGLTITTVAIVAGKVGVAVEEVHPLPLSEWTLTTVLIVGVVGEEAHPLPL